jgi:hypothetical protein
MDAPHPQSTPTRTAPRVGSLGDGDYIKSKATYASGFSRGLTQHRIHGGTMLLEVLVKLGFHKLFINQLVSGFTLDSTYGSIY